MRESEWSGAWRPGRCAPCALPTDRGEAGPESALCPVVPAPTGSVLHGAHATWLLAASLRLEGRAIRKNSPRCSEHQGRLGGRPEKQGGRRALAGGSFAAVLSSCEE